MDFGFRFRKGGRMSEVNELLDKLGQMEEAPLIWINQKLYTLIEEKQRAIKEYNKLSSHFHNELDLRIKLQERIDKAIEYIEKETYPDYERELSHGMYDTQIFELLDILKGGDK